MFRKFLFVVSFCFLVVGLQAQQDAMWLRYPAISPDGKNDCFRV
jgi:tricorn protease